MTRRHIHKAVKEQLVVMSGHLKSSAIARVTQISQRTVNRVLKLKQETGSVVRIPPTMGRPRLLNGLDVAYLERLVERTPDIFISELQFELYEARGVHVSSWTVQQALKQRGFTRKCVSTTRKTGLL
ncbi:hypothetical protein EDB83DRAFT_2223245 [Lactarius deliciosus]|nr:hypothetical protein EDB83DRAFT_2223245 [Lactarius deliciosus]